MLMEVWRLSVFPVYHIELFFWFVSSAPVLDEEEVLLAEETLSNHTDLVDNEPIANEARKKFIRLGWSVQMIGVICVNDQCESLVRYMNDPCKWLADLWMISVNGWCDVWMINMCVGE